MASNEGVGFQIIVIVVCFMFQVSSQTILNVICSKLKVFIKLVTMMEFSLTHGEPMIKNDERYLNLDSLRVKKVNRTHHLIIGNLTMYVNQGNDYELYGLLYKKQGNDYKKTPYKVGPNKFCDFLRDEKMFYPEVLTVSDFPSIDTCPWPSVTRLL